MSDMVLRDPIGLEKRSTDSPQLSPGSAVPYRCLCLFGWGMRCYDNGGQRMAWSIAVFLLPYSCQKAPQPARFNHAGNGISGNFELKVPR